MATVNPGLDADASAGEGTSMPGKSEIADRIAARGWSRAASSSAVDAVLDEITAALAAGERVTLTGFGTFEAATRAARTARNPRTGVSIDVPAVTVARFHPGTALRSRVAAGVAVPAATLGAAPVGSLTPAAKASVTSSAPKAAKAPAPGATTAAAVPEKAAAGKAATKSTSAKTKPVKADLKKAAAKKADLKAAAKKAEKSAKAKTTAKKKAKSDGKASSKHTKKKK